MVEFDENTIFTAYSVDRLSVLGSDADGHDTASSLLSNVSLARLRSASSRSFRSRGRRSIEKLDESVLVVADDVHQLGVLLGDLAHDRWQDGWVGSDLKCMYL